MRTDGIKMVSGKTVGKKAKKPVDVGKGEEDTARKVKKKKKKVKRTIKEKTEGGPLMGIMSHLQELKKHVLRSLIAVGVITFLTFSFGIEWFQYSGLSIPYPYPTLEDNMASMIFNRIRADLLPPDVQLIMIKPVDALLVNFQISLSVGVALGMVVIIREFGSFISPALKPRERRVVLRFALPALALFFAGCVFSYLLITPFTLDFLYSFGSGMGVEKFLSIDEFISFVLIMVLGMGLVFELPIIMVMISSSGLVDHTFWKKHWRIAVIVMIIIAGLITPDTTGITQMIVVVPMLMLYVMGYLASKRVSEGKEKGPTRINNS